MHSGGVDTETVAAPPLDSTGSGDEDSDTSHLTGDGPTVVVEVAPQAAASTAAVTVSAAQTARWPPL